MSYQLIRLSAGLEMRVDIPGRLILVDSVSTGQGVDIALVRSGTPSPYIPGRQAGFRLVEDFGGVLLRSALDCEVGIFLSINDVQLGGTAGGNVVVPDGVSVVNDLAHSIPVTLTSSSNTTPIPVSLASIRVNNTPEQAIPVLFSGTVAPVLGVVTVDNTNAEAIPVLQKPGETFEVHVNNAAPMAVSLTSTKISNTNAEAVPVLQKVGAVFESRVTNSDADAVPMRQKAGVTFVVQAAPMPVITDFAPVVVGLVRTLLVSDATQKRLRIRNTHPVASVVIGGAGVTLENGPVVIGPGGLWVEDDGAAAEWYAISDTADVTMQIQGLK
ncbi:hypothetical protein [Janthinobacterium sp. Ant5-2-1]|uniref:hypothetical protein n=1 Tax=Janthinobacterium sp. Ant5-2-1 TaxID=1755239 RepID=UPI000717E365|nr:hypothetical protein [Janthinobacterium sp. Ant5-2-1]